MSVLKSRVDHFVEEHDRLLTQLNIALSDRQIKVYPTDDLTHLDPLRMPSSHNFIAIKEELGERIGYCFSISSADCALPNFDIVPAIADKVLAQIQRAF
jgi:hypothetical protein